MTITTPFPMRSGALHAPSRVMFGPHETNLGTGRVFSDRHVAYYARRAAGGAGVIVTEEASVHALDWPYERCPLAADCGPGWAAITAAVRTAAPGTVVLAAIGHSGGQGSSAYSQRELWAPSGVPEVNTREVPKVMEQADIDDVVTGFASAARLAVANGCDGVEINAGQFSLVRQFISGLTNMRSDGYGSDRLTFARDVIAAVRDAIGGDSAVLALRLSCDELAPWAGVTPEAASAIAVELCRSGVDLLTVVRGSIFSAALTRPDQHVPPMFNRDLTSSIRRALRDAGVEVPVVLQGSVVDPDDAGAAIADGVCDAVEMTRALLADADLVTKVRSGLAARVRPCLLCNQACKVRDNRNPIVTCVMDPRTGHETQDPAEPTAPVAPRPGHHSVPVTIVGGGPAGLEAARWLALHGRTAVVHERDSLFGGVVRIAAAGAGRARLAHAADWLEAECRALGVDLRPASNVSTRPPDPAIYATGGIPTAVPFALEHMQPDPADSRPETTALEGGLGCMRAREPVVVDATEVLSGRVVLPQGTIAVWDPIGGPIAISVAESLASAGRAVVLITPDLLVGEKLALSGDLAPAQPRLHGAGVVLVTRALVRRVSANAVHVEDRFSGVASSIDAVALVACAHRLPDHTLGDEHALRIGDAVAPRTILEAILEGRRAATRLLAMA